MKLLPVNKVQLPRKIKYLVEIPILNGIVLFNLLTRNIVLLGKPEYDSFFTSEYALNNYYTVDVHFNEYNTVKIIRKILNQLDNDNRLVKDHKYIIFTTLDCNAHCPYCFENGFKNNTTMDNQIATQVADWIVKHSGGKKVTLTWFGGEPLLNREAITTISDCLAVQNIDFRGYIFTNGYLIDNDFVARATTNWKIDGVEITLDGTEDIYNKIKNFEDKNAFAVVLGNLLTISNAGLKVIIRINLSTQNYTNMLLLLDLLKSKLNISSNISLHVEKMYFKTQGKYNHYDLNEFDQLEKIYRLFIDEAEAKGYIIEINALYKKLKSCNCYADRAGGYVIFPNGSIGLCEHYINDFVVGNIYTDTCNMEIARRFRTRLEDLEECFQCQFYTECLRMEKCDFHHNFCSQEHKKTILWKIARELHREIRDENSV